MIGVAGERGRVFILPPCGLPVARPQEVLAPVRQCFSSAYLSWALFSSLSQVPSVASLQVLHLPLVGFFNLFTLLLIVPAITSLNEPSVSCQDPSQVNLGEVLENLQCLLAS